jgi:hypothetical protein
MARTGALVFAAGPGREWRQDRTADRMTGTVAPKNSRSLFRYALELQCSTEGLHGHAMCHRLTWRKMLR